MNKIRFIHTADIHLGSLLQIAGDPKSTAVDKAVREATLESFSRVCSTAISEDVDFVVISGDLYDREARSVKAQSFFVEECKRLEASNIKVFVIAGNHDPLREERDLFRMPKNVKVFGGNEPEIHEITNENNIPIARIIGQSYGSRSERNKMHLYYNVPDANLWNIALLHTQLESGNSNYVPCTLGDLRRKENIHYWALGHIHKHEILSDTQPYIVFPGIPQGRDFGEQGRGGCILVELDNFKSEPITFIPIAPVIYKRIEIFVDEDKENILEDMDDLREKIYLEGNRLLDGGAEGPHSIEGYIIEWIIRGKGNIHDLIHEQREETLEVLLDDIRNYFEHNSPFIWTDAVTIRTESPEDYEKILENSQILEELDSLIEQCITKESVRDSLMGELGDIWRGHGDYEDHQDIDDFRFYMDTETLEEILHSARQRIVEGLAQEVKKQ